MNVLRTTIAVLALAVGAAGCASAQGGATATEQPVRCLAPAADRADTKSVIAVLTDLTGAEPNVARRTKAFDTVVTSGFKRKAVLLGEVIGRGRQDAELTFNTALVGEGDNDFTRQANARCKRAAVTATFTEVAGRHSSGPTDVLSALRTLDEHLTGLPKADVDVVLFSTMVNTSAELNLSDPDALAEGIDAAVEALRDSGRLPDCRGWKVHAVLDVGAPGIGLSGEIQSQLESFWRTLFERCGGQLVLFDTDLVTFPVKPTGGQAMGAAAVAATPSVTRVGGVTTFDLPAPALFDIGSSDLRADAEAILLDLDLDELATKPGVDIMVVGHTDATGDAGANQQLSQDRAERVRQWLIHHGVPASRIEAVGRGETEPVADNDSPESRQQNRRVEVIITARDDAPTSSRTTTQQMSVHP